MYDKAKDILSLKNSEVTVSQKEQLRVPLVERKAVLTYRRDLYPSPGIIIPTKSR